MATETVHDNIIWSMWKNRQHTGIIASRVLEAQARAQKLHIIIVRGKNVP